MHTIEVDPEIFRSFAIYGSILAMKLLAMPALIGRYRFQKKIFLSPEDTTILKGSKVLYNDPDIERVRRAHLNDLENIPIWYVVTLLWLTTQPPAWLAGILIKTFVFARIVHTASYLYAVQPYRAIAFLVGIGVTVYQVFSTILYYY